MGILAAGVLLVVSAAMNWRFGLSLGRTELDGQIYGAASAAADCLKALVPFFLFAAIRNRAWSQAAAAMVVWVVVTAYSLTSAFGHAALNRFDVAGERAHEKTLFDNLSADLARAKEQLSWVPQHRPAGTIQAEIDTAKNEKRWASTNGCTDVTQSKSRQFCEGYNALVSELASAQQADALETRIAEVQAKIGEIDGGKAMTEADPQAAVIAKLTGIDIDKIQLGMTLFIALLLEVGSGFGLYIATSQWRIHERRPSAPEFLTPVHTMPVATAPVVPATVSIERSLPGANDNVTKTEEIASDSEGTETRAPLRLRAPESDVQRFYREGTEPKDGAAPTLTETYEAYVAWCQSLKKEPMIPTHFHRDFGELGVEKVRISGRKCYTGIGLRPEFSSAEDKNTPVFGIKAA